MPTDANATMTTTRRRQHDDDDNSGDSDFEAKVSGHHSLLHHSHSNFTFEGFLLSNFVDPLARILNESTHRS